MKEAFDCMPKEQFEFISNIQEDMLENTNMTKDEAWDFGFRCWQCGYAKVEKKNIVSEVEVEYINKSTEHINKSGDCSTGWIPCSERMPEDFQSVLCYAESLARRPDTMFVGSQKHGFWFLQSSIGTESFPTQYKVVAWMPLPEPYKTEKGE